MDSQRQMELEHSYRNPFTDYHANRIDVDALLDYWCDPWSVFNTRGLSERRVFEESGPLVFIGGRGSGKTMFLRYFSIDVQGARYTRENDSGSFAGYLEAQGAIGIYVRFDGATLSSFEGSNVSDEVWRNLFVHYFELFLAREYLVAVKTIADRDSAIAGTVKKFIAEAWKLFGSDDLEMPETISMFVSVVNQRLKEITNYRAQVGFAPATFKPSRAYAAQELSFGLADLILSSFPELGPRTKFIVLLDEYENFNASQQRFVNTLLKFASIRVTFRVGMRRNGWRDTGTVNDDDFIKEGRDYEKFVFEEMLHSKRKGYREFLLDVASRRMARVPFYSEKGDTDIRKYLGNAEDLESEAQQIVAGDKTRIDEYFQSKVKVGELEPNRSPLVRTLGYLWLVRGQPKDKTNIAIREYEAGEKTELAQQFRYDYINKYRLSTCILLASIYRKRKAYYSFNTYSYLSSGMVGHFIELCRYAFRYAEFESNTGAVESRIRMDLQARAAREVGIDQLQQVKRIANHGRRLYRLVENLGAIFRTYHLDLRIRYPETNQFSLDQSQLGEENASVFDAALMWSVIQQKPTLQADAPRQKRTELFTLNRIFSPVFEISYRTRGGISEAYNGLDFIKLISSENVVPKRELTVPKGDSSDSHQESLF